MKIRNVFQIFWVSKIELELIIFVLILCKFFFQSFEFLLNGLLLILNVLEVIESEQLNFRAYISCMYARSNTKRVSKNCSWRFPLIFVQQQLRTDVLIHYINKLIVSLPNIAYFLKTYYLIKIFDLFCYLQYQKTQNKTFHDWPLTFYRLQT